MKSKKIIAAIACCFCGSVYASDVSVYGMVDAYVQLYNGGNGTVVDLGSGGKGGSRIGIKETVSLSITVPIPPPLSRKDGPFSEKRFSESETLTGVRFLSAVSTP